MLTSKEAAHLYLKDFGTNLEKLREMRGLSKSKMAEICHMDLSNYSKYEKGENNVSTETMLRFASALDMEPKDFVDFPFDKKKFKIKY